ncbi:MAG: SurA N-terminal domain-containing protein [Pyrinomonadaceae bacterium]
MQKLSMKFILSIALILTAAVYFVACDSSKTATTTAATDVAATVNGKPIKNEEVEKIIKQQLQGQETKLSPLELAQARLQALDNLIQQEVMYQKADKEKTLPTDEEVTQAINEEKQRSGMTSDDYNKKLQEIGETDASLREKFKKQLAFKKLVDKLSSTIEPPKDKEVEDFFKGNPSYFVKKRGATFKAIVLDPSDGGNNDTTKSPQEVQLKISEINNKLKQGATFEALAAEYSEEPNTKLRSGDWRDMSEAEMKQLLGDSFAAYVMDKAPIGSIIPQPIPLEGRTLLLKIAAKQEKDENLTLESPDVKTGITTSLTNQRKQLLTAAYQAKALDEARIENNLAKRVIDNPNELSGARPADANAMASPAASPVSSPVAAVSPAVSVSPAKK